MLGNEIDVLSSQCDSLPVRAAETAPRVLVVAPGLASRGGIVSVVRLHRTMPLWQETRSELLETYDDRGTSAKIRAALRAYLMAPYKVFLADIVHLHLAGEISLMRKLPIAAVARVLRRPLLVHIHASSPESLFSATPAWAVRWVLSRADRVIALSQGWADLIRARVADVQINIVPNPVRNFAVPPRAQGRQRAILFVGRLEERKGYNTLLQAAVKVIQRFPDTQFWFAGHGELDLAASEAERLGIQGSVHLLGWTDEEKTAQLYRQAAVFCLPSRNEGLPMSVLEAMSHGTPVVCTRVGGLPELIVDGETGLYAEIGDPSSTADRITHLLGDPDYANEIATAAYHHVQATCGLSAVEQSLRTIYLDLGRKDFAVRRTSTASS